MSAQFQRLFATEKLNAKTQRRKELTKKKYIHFFSPAPLRLLRLCIYFFYCLYAFPVFSNASGTKEIDFFQVEEFSKNRNQLESEMKAQIRGFLYKSGRDRFILAAEPDLKSCCIGSKTKRHWQLLVFGDIPSDYLTKYAPVMLEGKLKLNVSLDEPLYLTDAKVVEEESHGSLLKIVLLTGSCLLIGLVYSNKS